MTLVLGTPIPAYSQCCEIATRHPLRVRQHHAGGSGVIGTLHLTRTPLIALTRAGRRKYTRRAMNRRTFCSLPLAALPAFSQNDPGAPTAVIERWKDLRFGMFIHWGPVSIVGTEISWSRAGERRGRHDAHTGNVPVEIYDNLYRIFNPVKFNPDQWVQLATDAGMKYLVFTCKHHDGFCNFDSKLTDYKITSPRSPYWQGHRQATRGCLPPRRNRLGRVLLATRLAPSRLSQRRGASEVHRILARAGARVADQLRQDRHVVLRRSRRRDGGLGRPAADPHDAPVAARPGHQRSRRHPGRLRYPRAGNRHVSEQPAMGDLRHRRPAVGVQSGRHPASHRGMPARAGLLRHRRRQPAV